MKNKYKRLKKIPEFARNHSTSLSIPEKKTYETPAPTFNTTPGKFRSDIRWFSRHAKFTPIVENLS